MPKVKISEYSSTQASNTDIDSVNIAEGCAPSGINNAIREVMAHLKDFQTGAASDNLTVGGNLAVTGTTTNTGNVTAVNLTATNLTASTSAVIASADINAGTIDGTVIGGSSALAITGTTITASTGFVGGLTGAVTGNTAGTHTGAVTGNVTGNLTGNVTASTGSSTFNNVTINGTLDMDAASAATITNLPTPTNSGDAANKSYVDTQVSNLVASAPAALNTLNELAAALGNDASFSTTVTNSIAAKLPLAGGTMSGAIAMGTSKITGLGTPTADADASTKAYVDTQSALKLSLTGGTMSGAIAMGSAKITGLGTPTADADATTKLYVDGILGSATSAATSASAAATSASNASTSASNASTSAGNASTSATAASDSATAAAASYDSFDDRYLGSKSSAPTVDNDGNALLTGALYWNSTSSQLFLWSGSAWTQAALTAGSFATLSGTQTFTGTNTFTGSSSATAIVLNDAAEVATVSATAATGTINYDITTQSVLYYTSNASANWTVNFRGSSGTSLNTLMSTGQSMTVAFLVTQGATAYYNNVVQVDGTATGVTTRWLGGAPTAGNASGIDSYRYLIIKTGSATFTVLASNTQFKA
jgi:hypothetical protein